MNHEDYEKAANYWKVKDAKNKVVSQERLLSSIEAFLQENNTCALATGTGCFIRCTPIEYTYHEKALWMFTEGGEKFIALENNKNVCIAIYHPYQGIGSLKGMQITGIAELVEPFSEEYINAAEFRKIPLDALKKLPDVMNLIKVTPVKIEFLNSEFKKEGYSSRQSIILTNEKE